MTQAKYNLVRVLHEWEVGREAVLTPAKRLEQLFRAHRLRNFIFAVGVANFDGTSGAGARFQGIGKGKTPPFADTIVLTDLYWSDQCYYQVFGETPLFGARVNVIGAPGVYAEDFFGAGQFIPLNFLGHVSPDTADLGFSNVDVPSRAVDFVPRMLRAGEYLQIEAAVDPPSAFFNPLGNSIPIIAVFNSVKALCENEPYACPSPTILEMCRNYVKMQPRETFILDVRIPQTDFPALRGERKFKTEAQSRPLLIWGIGSNISGAQIQIRDDTKQYDLTALYPQNEFTFIEGNGTLFNDPTAFNDSYCPIWGIAPSASDMQIGSAYKWLPVPHFIEPGAQLVITLKNGLRWYNQPMSVGGNNTTAPGHLSFMCTTL